MSIPQSFKVPLFYTTQSIFTWGDLELAAGRRMKVSFNTGAVEEITEETMYLLEGLWGVKIYFGKTALWEREQEGFLGRDQLFMVMKSTKIGGLMVNEGTIYKAESPKGLNVDYEDKLAAEREMRLKLLHSDGKVFVAAKASEIRSLVKDKHLKLIEADLLE